MKSTLTGARISPASAVSWPRSPASFLAPQVGTTSLRCRLSSPSLFHLLHLYFRSLRLFRHPRVTRVTRKPPKLKPPQRPQLVRLLRLLWLVRLLRLFRLFRSSIQIVSLWSSLLSTCFLYFVSLWFQFRKYARMWARYTLCYEQI